MKKIPMGFDLRFLNSDYEKAVDQIFDSTLPEYGFDHVVIPAALASASLADRIHDKGGKIGIIADYTWISENKTLLSVFDYIEIECNADFAKNIELLQKEAPDIFITVVAKTDQVMSCTDADAWRMDEKLPVDFFDFTRNVLDSCLGTSVEDCNDFPSACKERAHLSFFSNMYCIPSLLPVIPNFDPERLKAILTMYGITHSPVFLTTLPSDITKEQEAILANPVWKMVLQDEGRPGGQLRYFDPWHGLYKRTSLDGRKWLFILNRCHGNTPNELRSEDLDLPKGQDFVLLDLYENTQVRSQNGIFVDNVDTSDHPETPCCRLYEGRALSV